MWVSGGLSRFLNLYKPSSKKVFRRFFFTSSGYGTDVGQTGTRLLGQRYGSEDCRSFILYYVRKKKFED